MPAATITLATLDDFPQLWDFMAGIIQGENTHCYAPTLTLAAMRDEWFKPTTWTYKAMFGQTIVGTFQLRPNFGGRGAHIGNASYMVHHAHRGVGIGKAMGLFSFDEAKRKGFTAMQFNSVISTNTRAVQLWQSLGFDIIGTVPRAYQHHTQGLVDIYIMYRDL